MTNNNAPNDLWRIQVAKLKLMFPHLAEEDFTFDYAMKDVMLDKLQAKLGKNREELNNLLTSLSQ